MVKRYGTTVDELADAADTRLSLIPQGSGWLAANLPASRSMQQLAELCRLSAEDVHVLRGPSQSASRVSAIATAAPC